MQLEQAKRRIWLCLKVSLVFLSPKTWLKNQQAHFLASWSPKRQRSLLLVDLSDSRLSQLLILSARLPLQRMEESLETKPKPHLSQVGFSEVKTKNLLKMVSLEIRKSNQYKVVFSATRKPNLRQVFSAPKKARQVSLEIKKSNQYKVVFSVARKPNLREVFLAD